MRTNNDSVAIHFNEQEKEFHIQGLDFSYIFKVLKNNQLGHLYFGKRIRHRQNFSHLLKIPVRTNASYQFEDDPAFSLEIIKQEYPSYGTSDYREPAIHLLYEDGSRISNYEYKNHQIYKGKQALDGLPATYVEDDEEAITLEVHLFDSLKNSELILYYTVFTQFNALSRSAKLINFGKGLYTKCWG